MSITSASTPNFMMILIIERRQSVTEQSAQEKRRQGVTQEAAQEKRTNAVCCLLPLPSVCSWAVAQSRHMLELEPKWLRSTTPRHEGTYLCDCCMPGLRAAKRPQRGDIEATNLCDSCSPGLQMCAIPTRNCQNGPTMRAWRHRGDESA